MKGGGCLATSPSGSCPPPGTCLKTSLEWRVTSSARCVCSLSSAATRCICHPTNDSVRYRAEIFIADRAPYWYGVDDVICSRAVDLDGVFEVVLAARRARAAQQEINQARSCGSGRSAGCGAWAKC